MLNFLVSLILACQLIAPLQVAVTGIQAEQYNFPQRRLSYSFAPLIDAPSALALDVKSQRVLFQKQAYQPRPIASITKLMTAVIFLKQHVKPESYITIIDDDKLNGGSVLLTPGMKIKSYDLLEATLVGSLNNGATALAAATGLKNEEFVAAMNQQAADWGLSKTHFAEPSGLSPANQSTAMEVARLLKLALNYKEIRQALSHVSYTFYTQKGKRLMVRNTNKLLNSYLDEEGGKTGYTDEAGYCLVNLVRSKNVPEGIITVILGAKSKKQRFQENKFLSQWVFDNWQWQ